MVASYNPPYDSPIEDLFAYHFVKYADDKTEMRPQFCVQTQHGRFVLDFLLVASDGTRLAIECDGKEFHNSSRDEWRDAIVLGERHADVVHRLRGSDIVRNVESLLYVLSMLDERLFSKRGKINLTNQVWPTLRSTAIDCEAERVDIALAEEEDLVRVQITSRRAHVPDGKQSFWQTAYRHAESQPGRPLDEVIQSYRKLAWKT